MDKKNLYLIIGAIVLIGIFLLAFLMKKKSEGLSLSQFPFNNSTCRSCGFYTNKCGDMYYQEQNKSSTFGCDCNGFSVYRTKEPQSCYKQTLKGNPNVGDIQTCTEPFGCSTAGPFENNPWNFDGTGVETVNPGPRESSCKSCNGQHCCMDMASTFATPSTFLRNLPCDGIFPLVTPAFQPVVEKAVVHVSELDVYKALEQGQLIVAANDGRTIQYTMKKLIQATTDLLTGNNHGVPDFYSIMGPVCVFLKLGDVYYWMTGHPIGISPENISNHINHATSWNVAKTQWNRSRKSLNENAPVVFFSADPNTISTLRAATMACAGMPESNTDFYYQLKKNSAGCSSNSCLWSGKQVK